MGHFEHGAAQAALPSYMASAGQLTTTAADMARLAVFLMVDGGIDGRPFIEQLGVPSGTEAARAGLVIGHGLVTAGRDGRHIVSDGIHSHAMIGMPLFVGLWVSLTLGLLGWAYIVAVGADVCCVEGCGRAIRCSRR